MREQPPIREDNIFVVGCQRSGTSVIYGCLVKHPELAPLKPFDPTTKYDPKELWYFRNLFEGRRLFRSRMYGWEVDQQYLREVVDLTVRFCARRHGAKSGRWISANPVDGLNVREILETMPKTRIVFVLRHPQEVVWSHLHAPWADPNEPISRRKRVRQLSLYWQQYAKVAVGILDGDYPENVLLVRHEDIVERPGQVARAIVDHVGIADHPVVLKQLTNPTFNSSFRNGVSAVELRRQTRAAIAGDRAFCATVCQLTAGEMTRLGYRDFADHADDVPVSEQGAVPSHPEHSRGAVTAAAVQGLNWLDSVSPRVLKRMRALSRLASNKLGELNRKG